MFPSTLSKGEIIMDNVLFKVSAEELLQAAGEGREDGALLRDHCFDGQRKELTVLVTGKAGDGKSTLVNALLGHDACDSASNREPCMSIIGPLNKKGVEVRVFETQDPENDDDGDGQKSLRFGSMKDKRVDLLVVCIAMVGRAQSREFKDIFANITKELDIDIWQRALVVLTQANERVDQISQKQKRGQSATPYDQVVEQFSSIFRGYITASCNADGHSPQAEVVQDVPFVPTGIYLKGQETLRKLPDCDDWLSRFWLKCFSRCDVTSQPAFLAMAQDHLRIDDKELRAGLTIYLESIESSKKLASTGHDSLMVQPALSDGDQRRTLKQQVPKQQDADSSQGGPSPTSVSGNEQQSESQSLPITDQEQRTREQQVPSSKKLASTGHDALTVQPALSDGDQRRTLKQQVPKQQDADSSQGGPSPTSVSGNEQQSEAQSLPITDQEQRTREQVALPATEDQSQTGPANRNTKVAGLGPCGVCIIL